MKTLTRTMATCGIGAMLALGVVGANAQNAQANGSDYHPLQLNSPDNPAVDKGAVQAAHSTGTEAIGQSTSPPPMQSRLTRAEVRQGAIQANHAMTGEPTGQSTAMAMVKGPASH
jgi:hypothetical protein